MQITEYSIVGLRSSVIDLRARGTPLTFRLFPMAHIGRPQFYREVADRLRDCDLIVSEGEDAPSPHGLAIVTAMRFTRQRGARDLVHQDIDHAALGVPTVWPESWNGRSRRHGFSLLSMIEFAVLTPCYVVIMALGGRGWLLRTRFEVNDNTEVRIRFMNKTLVHERDAELISALDAIYQERRDRREVVAVVYGAGHMPAVINALNARFGYRAVGAEWLTIFEEADLYRAVG